MRDNYLIPKVLIHSDRYKNLQTDAAVLYAVLFDKSIMSDDDDDILVGDDGRRFFITSPVSEIVAGFDFVYKRAEILLRELDSEGLIKVVGQGNGNPHGIIVFPVSDGTERTAVEGIECPAAEEPERPAAEEPERPVAEELERPAVEELECPAVEEPECPAAEEPERREVSSVKLRYIGSPVVSEPREVVTDFDNDNTAPPPVSNRILVLQSACNNEFSPSVVRELWISMQDVIDKEHWDDLDFLSGWLRSMYGEMHSRVAGGDMFVRIALLQDLISEK